MRKLKKSVYVGVFGFVIFILFIVRCCSDNIPQRSKNQYDNTDTLAVDSAQIVTPESELVAQEAPQPLASSEISPVRYPSFKDAKGNPLPKHKIYSVSSFKACFSDMQDTHIVAAQKWGVKPVRDRTQAEQRKSELVYIGSNPFYYVDGRMRSSIPYLVPRASNLLQDIARSFLDSLAIKQIPLHRVLVTSVLRTEEDVQKLRKHNSNASEQSCHRFGTTFDISYIHYSTVSHPDGPRRREVRNDTLKWVLSEVLNDKKNEGRCYVKHEVKQSCFHITVR